MKNIFLLLLVALFSWGGVAAQTPGEILGQLQRVISASEKSYTMELSVYAGVDASSPEHTVRTYLSQVPGRAYTRIETAGAELEQYMDRSAMIEVDHTNHTLFFRAVEESADFSPPNQLAELIAFSQQEGVSVQAVHNGEYPGVHISAPGYSGTQLTMYYDQGYRLTACEFLINVTDDYGQTINQKITCTFDYRQPQEKRGLSDFVKINGTDIQPAGAFSNYTLIL